MPRCVFLALWSWVRLGHFSPPWASPGGPCPGWHPEDEAGFRVCHPASGVSRPSTPLGEVSVLRAGVNLTGRSLSQAGPAVGRQLLLLPEDCSAPQAGRELRHASSDAHRGGIAALGRWAQPVLEKGIWTDPGGAAEPSQNCLWVGGQGFGQESGGKMGGAQRRTESGAFSGSRGPGRGPVG